MKNTEGTLPSLLYYSLTVYVTKMASYNVTSRGNDDLERGYGYNPRCRTYHIVHIVVKGNTPVYHTLLTRKISHRRTYEVKWTST